MMPAAKHLDLIMGIDNHVATVPPAPVPAPYVGIVFDPFDYLPFIGSTVMINGLHRAQAGTAGMATPSHLPVPSAFAPPASNESEMFMGSSTVSVDGDAQTYAMLPVLSCQTVGMPAPARPKGSPPKSLLLPTSMVLPIPAGPQVLIGGPPTISLSAMAMKGATAGLSRLGKGLRVLQRGTGRVGDAMRAATKKLNAAGDALASALKLGPKARNAIERGICTLTGHPVDVATGKVLTDHIDFELPGPLPLRWERAWYSTSTYQGPLGHGWHHAYDLGLYVADDVILYRAADGRLISLPVLEVGQEHFDATERLTLARDPDGYAIVDSGRTRYCFRDIGRDHREHVLGEIVDDAGERIQLRYDKDNRLVEIIDSTRRSLQLRNDADGRILTITAPHPDQPDARFVVVQYAYDARGDLSQASDALSQPFRYEYKKHLLTRETNRNGLSFYFEYDGEDADAWCVRTWGDGGIYDHRLSYDREQGITTVTNSLGYKTQYQYEGGLVVCMVDAIGAVHRTMYDEHNRKVQETDALDHTRFLRYDERGNLVELFEPDGAQVRVQYDARDRPIAAVDPNDGSWAWTYDAQGKLTARTDPLGRATRFAYDAGKLAGVTDPGGHTTRFDHDKQHNLTAVHTPDGASDSLEYDALGRMTARTDPNGNIYRYAYDLLGRPVRNSVWPARASRWATHSLAHGPRGKSPQRSSR